MAIPDLTGPHLQYHNDKIAALTPQSQRLWGEMTPERMLWHLRRTIELTMGEGAGDLKPIAPPVIRNVIAFLFFDVFTNWPKGKLKATPELLSDEVGPFEDEQHRLLEACAAFAKRCDANPREKLIHPLTGKATLKRMAHLHGVHMNHHYKQFGLL